MMGLCVGYALGVGVGRPEILAILSAPSIEHGSQGRKTGADCGEAYFDDCPDHSIRVRP